MKTSRDEIALSALRLFAERGFDAVSTAMIAETIGITKGALYRHYTDKQAIFERIIGIMFELDEKQSRESNLPTKAYKDDGEAYQRASLGDLCAFVGEQYVFWTENEFACLFRRMITIEQFKSARMNKLYQDIIALGPVRYTEDLFCEMLLNGQLDDTAREMGAYALATQLFAPLALSLQLYDGGGNSAEIQNNLARITKDFEHRWIKH